jgi:Zn-dependent protease
MQPNRGFELGRPLGFPLLIHGSWLPAGVLLTAHLALSAYGERDLIPALVLGAGTVIAYFMCVLAHALAHLFSARLSQAPRERVKLFIFGDVSVAFTGPGAVRTALAGPLASAAIAAVLYVASLSDFGDAAFLRTLAFVNAGLAALNLLPGLPLDGGRLFGVLGRDRRALTVAIGRICGFLAVVAGGWLLLGGPGRVEDTAFGLWLVLAGIFVVAESKAARGAAPVARKIADETVGAWARPFAGRIDAASAAPQSGGPYAVSEDGRLAGVLAEGHRGRVRTSDVMVPWSPALGMPADAPLMGALKRLADKHAPLVVVVDSAGVVRGVLDEAAVRSRLASR